MAGRRLAPTRSRKRPGSRPPAPRPPAARRSARVVPPGSVTFGRDPNDLTNAYGRLPNDRPAHVPGDGQRRRAAHRDRRRREPSVLHRQALGGHDDAGLPQGSQRILLEPRGSRRLSSQTLLDLRVSRTIRFGGVGRVELLVDVLNALNEAAEEGLATDNLFGSSATFGRERSSWIRAARCSVRG